MLIIPTPGGGTKLQPLTPEVMSSTGLVLDPLFPHPPRGRVALPATSVSPAGPSASAASAASPTRDSSDSGEAASASPGRIHPAMLEYVVNDSDGSCMCKLCGEVLSSRTHWYRHKYKVTHALQVLHEATKK